MIVIGLDPSLPNLGYCAREGTKIIEADLIETQRGKPKGNERFDVVQDDARRLDEIMDVLDKVIDRVVPEVAVIEWAPPILYAGRATKKDVGRALSLLKLYVVIGACFAKFWSAGCNLYVVTPAQWKGRDGKQDSLNKANLLLRASGIDVVLRTKKDENIADAICLAFCSVVPTGIRRVFQKKGK